MTGAVRVLTVDDQPVAREALKALVTATDGFELIGEADSGAQALVAVEALRPDLVLVDVRMPRMDGFETTRRICEGRNGGPMVVLVSTDARPEDHAVATAAGAAAFIPKERLACNVLVELWRGRAGAP